MALSDLGSEVGAVKSFFNQPAENYGNDQNIEFQWAMKAYHHAETYFNLVKSVEPRLLKLTKVDDEVYEDFRETFPDLKVAKIHDDQLKSDKEKARWRQFCDKYKGRVDDFNMGCLLRLDSSEDINDQNTTLVPRIQFLAIEVARNREGCNDGLRTKYKKS